MIDFTNCPNDSKCYGGSNGKKKAVIFNGDRYLLKFPTHGSIKNPQLRTSYSNNCISEHIGSSIFNILGISAQKTFLGFYSFDNKSYIVVACKDFETRDERFQDFGSLKNSTFNRSSSDGYGTILTDVLSTIREQNVYDPVSLERFFWEMCTVDAFIGNFDRHNGNWGFLRNENTGIFSIAPIFDCGSCLYPQAVHEETIDQILNNENELKTRIFTRPLSAFRTSDGQKIPYQELFDFSNLLCKESFISMYRTINKKIDEIQAFIASFEIDSKLKYFYSFMLDKRNKMLLKPLYDKCCQK